MRVKAVELMRNVREQVLKDTQGMSWNEEQQYLKAHSSSMHGFFKTNVQGYSSGHKSAERLNK